MAIGRPSVVTATQREELWRRYKTGETILGIGRALGQRTGNLYRLLEAAGGIAPPQRTRSERVLSFSEREEISRGIAAGDTFRGIARRKLPTALRKSLTWDRGSELADHAKFTVATDVKVYFCDPYSPWLRGSNECGPPSLNRPE